MSRFFAALAIAAALTGCKTTPDKVYYREMLGKSIADFTDPLQEPSGTKIWINSMKDDECDKGCTVGAAPAGALGAVGGLFGGLGGGGAGSFDGLAYEVFSNFITQKKKGRIVENHKHNYMTESAASTRRNQEVLVDGKPVGVQISCEDLCLLSEAKKKRSDKVLAYQIIEMEPEKLVIHLRYSDTKTGLVELSRTFRILGMSVTDWSF
jgi:hypothetical protein